jgi:hypothetical protein
MAQPCITGIMQVLKFRKNLMPRKSISKTVLIVVTVGSNLLILKELKSKTALNLISSLQLLRLVTLNHYLVTVYANALGTSIMTIGTLTI